MRKNPLVMLALLSVVAAVVAGCDNSGGAIQPLTAPGGPGANQRHHGAAPAATQPAGAAVIKT